MQKTIISDTSCLILLHNIGELEILHKLFGIIITTEEVVTEYGEILPEWVEIKKPKNSNYNLLFDTRLGKGEASAIALAMELEDCLLIMDDLKARKTAQHLGLTVVGTLGLIVDAKLIGIIPTIKPILNKIRSTNFRISKQLEKILLEYANE